MDIEMFIMENSILETNIEYNASMELFIMNDVEFETFLNK